MDGGYEWRANRVNQTISGATSGEELFRFLADQLDIPVRRIELPDDYDLSYGSVLIGSTRDALTRLADSLGVTWSIQDNELVVLPENEHSGRTAPTYSPENGTLLSASKTDDGVEVRALYWQPVSPGDAFHVEGSTSISDGFYRAERVDIDLDSSYSDDWWQTIEGVEVS